MYIRFSDPLNAQATTLRPWEKPVAGLARWVARLVQQHQHRKASALLKELDARLLRDIDRPEEVRDAASLSLRKQLLRAI
jgi:hypothetical protein